MAPKRIGRPPIYDVPTTARLYVRVTSAQRLALERVAEQNRTDLSGVIREAVNEYVTDYGERRVFPRRR